MIAETSLGRNAKLISTLIFDRTSKGARESASPKIVFRREMKREEGVQWSEDNDLFTDDRWWGLGWGDGTNPRPDSRWKEVPGDVVG